MLLPAQQHMSLRATEAGIVVGHFHYHWGCWGMYGKALRRALAVVVLFTLGASASSGLSADSATTSFGRSLFAVLDDSDPLIRSYGWNSLAWLGTVSNPNALHTAAFKRFLNDDRQALLRRMEALLAKLHDKTLTESQAKAASAEYDDLRQAALGVPEIAELLVSSPALAESVSANDLAQVKQASTRVRPETPPIRLTYVPDDIVANSISGLKSLQGKQHRDARHDAATTLAGLQLNASQLDAVEALLKDASIDIDSRRILALALIHNGRTAPALAFIDEQLSGPNSTNESTTFALQALTELAFVDPAAARNAVAARTALLLPHLGEFEHFADATAVLGLLSGDEIAKLDSQALLKRFELETDLSGSSCIYASTLTRSPGPSLGLALLGSLERHRDTGDADKIAACIIFLDPGTPASRYLRDLTVGKQLDSPADRQKRFSYLDTLWSQAAEINATALPNTSANVRKALVAGASNLVDAVPFFSFAGVDSIATWSNRAEPFGLAAAFVQPYWLRWTITRIPGFASALAVWLIALVALVLMSHSNNVRAFLLFHPLGKQLGVFGQVNALIFAVPGLRRNFFQPYRSAMLGVLAQQYSRGYEDKAYFVGSGAVPLQRTRIAAQVRDLDRRTVSGNTSSPGSVVAALKTWKGRVVLVGASGRGKTMFLCHHILGADSIREPAIFAQASSLRGDPRSAILARFGRAVTDEGFLDSLITSGKLDI
jgi:hypothetical protein